MKRRGVGGSVWESNPPVPARGRDADGFEVREGHRTPCASGRDYGPGALRWTQTKRQPGRRWPLRSAIRPRERGWEARSGARARLRRAQRGGDGTKSRGRHVAALELSQPRLQVGASPARAERQFRENRRDRLPQLGHRVFLLGIHRRSSSKARMKGEFTRPADPCYSPRLRPSWGCSSVWESA